MTEDSQHISFFLDDKYNSHPLILKVVDIFSSGRLNNSILFEFDDLTNAGNFLYNLCYLCLKSKIENQEDLLRLDYMFNNNTFHDLSVILSNDNIVKIDDIRKLIEFSQYNPVYFGYKFCIIDSIDNCNINASNALLKSLEDGNRNVFYFLISRNKRPILRTIYSRVLKFKVKNGQNLVKNSNDIVSGLIDNITKDINNSRPVYKTLSDFLKNNKKEYSDLFLKDKILFVLGFIIDKLFLSLDNDIKKLRIIKSFDKLKFDLLDQSLSLISFIDFSNQISKNISIKL